MIKRVNFTGRRRIPRDRVDIEVYDGAPRRFDATINLEGMLLFPQAAVFLEAGCAGSNVIERFEFGEVGNIRAPANRDLEKVEGENVSFTLKVVDRTELVGRILGIAEHIRPQRAGKQTAAGRRGILPIEPYDLGQELWQLAFRDHDVFLLVNKDVAGLVDRARSDPLFHALVYPQVVRNILGHAIEENVDIDEEDDRWPVLWLKFGKNLHPDRLNPPGPEDTEDERTEWIDNVVEAFCDAHVFKDKFKSAALPRDGGEP